MTKRQLATSAVAAGLGLLVALAGFAGRADLAAGGLGLLLAGVLIMLVDIRRRQGDIAKRLRQIARRQALDSKRIGWLRSMPKNVKKDVKSALRPAVASIGDTVDRAVGHVQAAGDGVSAGLAQERLAAAERHVQLVDDLGALANGISGARTDIGTVRDDVGGVLAGVGDVRADLDGVRTGITEAKDEVVARVHEADQDGKRRQVTLQRHVAKLSYEPVRQVQGLLQLVDRFDVRAPLPPTGGWAMEPSTILRLVRIVELTRPGLVVECGSGASSVWLAYALQAGGGRLVSLEHDERYAEQTRQMLDEHGLTANAEVRSAPLTELKLGQETFQWYDTEAVGDLHDIALLLVDGPPRASGPRARYPAVPVLGPRLATGARVVIDDVDRTEEQEAAEAWLAEFPGLEREGSPVDRSATLVYRPA